MYKAVRTREADMGTRAPALEVVKASEARQQWSELLGRVFRRQARFIVERSGVPIAVLVSLEDLERIKRMEQQREQAFAIVDEVRGAFKDVTTEEIEREAVRALGEARKCRSARLDQ